MDGAVAEANVVSGGAPRNLDAAAADDDVARVAERPAEPYRPWIARLLARHPGGLLTGTYLVLTAVGITYDFFYFIRFRINILDYAQTGDFLVAALREPVAIFYCAIPVVAIWLAALFRRWVRRKSPRYDAYAAKYEKRWKVGPRYWDVVNTTLVTLYALLFVVEYAGHEARVMREGSWKQVRVRLLSDGGTPLGAAGRVATLIGSTSGYLFLYDRSGDSTYAVPVSNVAHVAVRSSKRRGAAGAAGAADSVAPAAAAPVAAP